MVEHERYEALMLEHLYGLLEPDEARDLQAYLETPAGADLRARASTWQSKIGFAAKVEHPDVSFQIPTDNPSPAPKAVVVPAPGASARPTMTRVWARWGVAAALLLVLGGFGGPAGYQLVGWYLQSQEVDYWTQAVAERKADVAAAEEGARVARAAVQKDVETAAATEQEVAKGYAAALQSAQKAIEDKQFVVRLNGPPRIEPGAPNTWEISTLNTSGTFALPKKVDVVVKDDQDRELLRETHNQPTGPTPLKLTTAFWDGVKPGSDLFLEVVAYTDDNQRRVLAERVPLARPIYVTHLVTDKPLYKPGETIRFRSLTLDRGTFLPPAHDVHVRFRLRDPVEVQTAIGDGNGRVVAGMKPVVGPDGKPLRGLGVGEYDLSPDAAGGEYKLDVLEVEPSGKENLLETRKFLVNRYTPDVFEKKLEFDGKTYGPGDAVQARLEVSRTAGGPMKDARVTVLAVVDGRTLLSGKNRPVVVLPVPGTANTKAICDVRFQLPTDLFDKAVRKDVPPNVTLTVTIRDGDTVEAIVRPVPLVTRNLKVEFYPEGGDLIAGVEGRVYFQVRTPQNKPADLKGRITDGTDTVAEVSTLTDAENPGANRGQGAFTFAPKAGKKYFLKLVSPPGIVEPTKDGFPLPVVKDDGVALTALDAVTDTGAPIRVRLRSPTGPKVLHVGAYARGRLIGQQRVEVEPGRPADVTLAGEAGLGGVTRVTVFEEADAGNLVPRAERLVYRKPGEGLILTVNPDKAGYSPSDKVKLELGALNEKEAPVPAVLLVGVVNRSVVAMADNKTDRLMPTHFLLAGDVKHPADLEHADFLLTDHPKAAVALDLLLGTQGWRRFAEQLLAPANPLDRGEVERMMIAHGQRPVATVELFKLEEQRISAEFRPQLEEVRLRQAAARDALVAFQRTTEPELHQKVTNARFNSQSAESQYVAAAAELYHFETRFDRVRSWALPAFLISLIALGVGGLILAGRGPTADRRRLVLASAGAFALAALVFGSLLLTRATDAARYARSTRDMQEGNRNTRGDLNTPAPGRMAAPAGPERKAPPKDAAPRPDAMAMPAPAPTPAPGPMRNQDPSKVDRGEPLPRPARPGYDGPVVGDRKVRDREQAQLNELVRAPGGRGPAKGAARGPQIMVAHPDAPLPVAAPPTLVREYAHQRDPALGETRVDFTETVYWHPVLVLPNTGKATVEFQLSDDVARYEILVAGHTTDGRIGAVKHTIEARKPFTVDPKLPLEVSSTDVIDVPVRVMNDSSAKRSVAYKLNPIGFAVEAGEGTIDLDAGKGGRPIVRVRPSLTEGDAALEVLGTSPAASPDAAARLVRVVPEGFPGVGQVSDMLERRASGVVALPKDVIPGTLKVRLELYPTTLADLVKGLDGLLREPCGCFEQSSTANYPNTLILQYMNATNQAQPEAARRARELLDRGYSKLTAFEVLDTATKGKQGFEWFGTPDQAHEALTAYGLLQFKDMGRVHAVDPELVRRTQAFLLSRRDGAGGFKSNPRAVDTFGRAPKHTTDAYIVWALVESDPDDAEKLDLAKEIGALKAEAMTADSTGGKDPYYLALAANVLLQRGDRTTAQALLDRLKDRHVQGGAVTGAVTSITRSGGRDLDIEKTALALLGWLRANDTRYAGTVKDASRWLSQQRGGRGGFGSTQSTILALKALVLHAKVNARPAEGGELTLLVAGKPAATRTFTDRDTEVVAIDLEKPEERLALGAKTEIEVVTTAKQPYPFTLSYTYSTLTPISGEKCAVKLETKLAREQGVEGETIPLTVRVDNRHQKGQGMAVAVVGLPAGMKVPTDLKQLTDLREKGVISHFETRGRELVLYWRALAPGQKVELTVELVCDVPGTYRGPASRAYLYYDADHKHWVEPLAVAIKPAE